LGSRFVSIGLIAAESNHPQFIGDITNNGRIPLLLLGEADFAALVFGATQTDEDRCQCTTRFSRTDLGLKEAV